MPIGANAITDWWYCSDQNCTQQIKDFESARSISEVDEPTFESSKALAETAYALAERLHTSADHRAVDYWARSIAWMDDAISLRSQSRRRKQVELHCSSCSHPVCRAKNVRQSAMTRILSVGPSYGRLNPSSHLLINGSMRSYRIPVSREGFAWQCHDFDRLLVLCPPSDAPGNVSGCGVPLIVFTRGQSFETSSPTICSRLFRTDEPCSPKPSFEPDSFVFPGTPFAATALMRFPLSMFMEAAIDETTDEPHELGASISFVNPLAVQPVDGRDQIAQSPALPLSYIQQVNRYDPVSAFVYGNNVVDRARLRFFEPYQADKIPLLFVHGLISDPTTFIEMADAVRADPLLRTRYQIWAFRYPTGEAFLKSAAMLRRDLAAAFAHNADCSDEPGVADASILGRAVIVGHSMGGLVAKMQIVDSGDRLWRAVANAPIDDLRGPTEQIDQLRDAFFFTANPYIGRVIYIATPHRGSPVAANCIGRLGSSLAGKRSNERQDFDAFVNANPGVFSGELTDSLPSSVDVLRPSSDLLRTLKSLDTPPHVAVNSIIGDHCRLPFAGKSDGIVPVDSAFVREAESTATVDASHTSIQRSKAAQKELVRILMQHAMTTE